MDKTLDERHEQDPPPSAKVTARRVMVVDEGDDGGAVGESKRPIPAVRKRRLVQTAVESSTSRAEERTIPSTYVSQGHMRQPEFEAMEEDDNNTASKLVYDESFQETSTISRTITKTFKSTTSSSHEYVMSEGYESLVTPKTPTTPSRLKQKVAIYEKAWQAGEKPVEHISQESLRSSTDATDIDINLDADNPFDIDVYEIEKRLREERRRGLAEAEAAKLAFQQIQLRSTPLSPARKVEIHEEHTASPFNVTLKTTSKISPGAVTGRIELEEHSSKSPFNVTLRTTQRYRRQPQTPEEAAQSSPFNVTLRTTKRPASSITSPTDMKAASARFLEGEKTVREVISADGVKTIITSSMTSDGRQHEEKIFRHGEGYLSPRVSPQREMRATTPSRSVDMTAGGPRILIKLENEEQLMEQRYVSQESFDVTDYQQRQVTSEYETKGNVSLETPPNIDIIVGATSNHPKRRPVSLETKFNEQMPWQTQQQQQHHQHYSSTTSSATSSAFTTKTTTKITTRSHEQYESLEQEAKSPMKNISISKTIQTQGSTSPGESQRFVTKHTIAADSLTSPTTTHYSSSSASASGSSSSYSPKTLTHKVTKTFSETQSHETESHEALKKRLEIVGYGREGLGRGTGELGYKTEKLIHAREVISDDSDTEGATASSIVIVPSPTTASVETKITPTTAGGALGAPSSSNINNGTLPKSLTTIQTQQQQSTTSTNTNEYQEIQSTMAAIQFARSNSQYDTHIKEKRGK